MPATKTITLKTWTAINNLLAYLKNQNHPNHEEYTIEPMRSAHPLLTPGQFMPAVKKIFEKMLSEKRGGRPIQNLCTLHILRVPDYSWLTPEERETYARHYIQTIAPDGLCLYCWHINKGMGSADLNVMVPNVVDLDRPRVRRQRGVNVITQARDTADAITTLINRNRLKKKKTDRHHAPAVA